MKKLLIITALLLLVLPVKGELAINIGGLYSGPFKIDGFTLNTLYNNPSIVSFDEKNRSDFTDSSKFGFNAGISFFFNYKLGFGINTSFLKTSFKVNNSFNWNWEWWNGTKGVIDPKNWTDTGNVSSIPISFNIIFRVISKEKFKLNLFAGPTIFLTSVELDGNGGKAGGPLLDAGFYYIDWYDLPLELSASKTVFGGNGGFEIEYMISQSMNIYLSAAYYYAGDLTLDWSVKSGQYTGEFGTLVITISDQILLSGYNIPIKLSTYTIGFGIKIYL